MQTEHLFFESSGYQLFGGLCTPSLRIPQTRKKGYLICHPFAEEKKSAHRVLIELAHDLCNHGHPVFLFDFRGCGDSEGDFADATTSDWLNDLAIALSNFKSRIGFQDIGLIGLRFGGFLALKAAARFEFISKIILLEPVLHPVKDFQRHIRQKLIKELHTEGNVASKRKDIFQDLETGSSIDFDGYKITSEFYQDLLRWDRDKFTPGNKAIILYHLSLISRTPAEYENFIRDCQNNGSDVLYRTVNIVPFWKKLDTPECGHLIQDVLKNC